MSFTNYIYLLNTQNLQLAEPKLINDFVHLLFDMNSVSRVKSMPENWKCNRF